MEYLSNKFAKMGENNVIIAAYEPGSLRSQPVESRSALRLVDEPFGCELRAERLKSSRSGPKGLQVVRL